MTFIIFFKKKLNLNFKKKYIKNPKNYQFFSLKNITFLKKFHKFINNFFFFLIPWLKNT